MKKKLLTLFLALTIGATAFTMTGCGFQRNPITNIFNGHNNNNVCYYGCPNSKRVKKLNLFKTKG